MELEGNCSEGCVFSTGNDVKDYNAQSYCFKIYRDLSDLQCHRFV